MPSAPQYSDPIRDATYTGDQQIPPKITPRPPSYTEAQCLEFLGLVGRPTPAEIEKAYRVKSKLHHPDRHQNCQEKVRLFQMLGEIRELTHLYHDWHVGRPGDYCKGLGLTFREGILHVAARLMLFGSLGPLLLGPSRRRRPSRAPLKDLLAPDLLLLPSQPRAVLLSQLRPRVFLSKLHLTLQKLVLLRKHLSSKLHLILVLRFELLRFHLRRLSHRNLFSSRLLLS